MNNLSTKDIFLLRSVKKNHIMNICMEAKDENKYFKHQLKQEWLLKTG